MAQTELGIDKSKADVVTRYKERLELLFSVKITVCLTRQCSLVEDGSDSCDDQATFGLLLSTSDTQENIEKAIVFLKAVLEESPEFIKEQKQYQQEDFEMVLKNSQLIERQCLSVLDFDVGKLEVCLRGERSNVRAAQQAIEALCMGQYGFVDADLKTGLSDVTRHFLQNQHQLHLQRRQVHLHEREEETCYPFPGMVSDFMRTDSPRDITQSSRRSPVRDIDNNVIFPIPADRLGSGKAVDLIVEEDFPSDSVSDSLVERGTAALRPLDKTFAQVVSPKEDLKVLPFSLPASPSSLDEEITRDLFDIDRSDPLYQSRLKFAVKLGYSEHHLEMALEKLGLACDEDKLLHELIENSVGTVDDSLVDSPTIIGTPPVDLGSSEEFLGVMKKVARCDDPSSNLRHIVIDGSNVAMHHGKTVFSCSGIKIAVNWFKQRGHKEITVFVPQWRKEPSRPDAPITNQEILRDLEKEGIVVFTPSRRIKGRRMVCYDDRFVLKLAAETNGIVVSNDTYRDLLNENQEYRKVVEERLLMYTFVNDRFMPPEDPLGRRGPTLDNFLRKEPTNPPPLPPPCPYGRKCTYGNKCKYYHPERGSQPHRSVTDMLKEQATIKMQEHANRGLESTEKGRRNKPRLTRTQSLVPAEYLSTEKLTATAQCHSLQEQDSDLVTQLRSPLKQSGKTSDYLSEHRKKLEEALAVKNTFASDNEIQYSRPHEAHSPRSQESPSLLPLRQGSRVSSPARLNVPYSDTQEGPLVSGHLLLAKKLSDEGSESTFFTGEGSSNRASPVALTSPPTTGVSRQESLPVHLEGRLPSVSESQHLFLHRQHQASHSPFYDEQSTFGLCISGPACLASQHLYQQDPIFTTASFGTQCNSYPTADHGAVGDHSYREHLYLKAQQSCPANQGFVPSGGSRALRGMMRQNSSSDPQLHMVGISEAGPGWHTAPVPASPLPAMDSVSGHSMFMSTGYPGQHADTQARHLMRSTSVQAQHRHPLQHSVPLPSLERQMSEGLFGSQDIYGLPSPSVYTVPEIPYSPFPTNITSGLMAAQSPQWHQDPFPVMLPSHVPAPTRSFPLDRPILPSDPRYSLYYNLCGIFAEPRVRAVMNKFPDETNPKKLCDSIMQMQL